MHIFWSQIHVAAVLFFLAVFVFKARLLFSGKLGKGTFYRNKTGAFIGLLAIFIFLSDAYLILSSQNNGEPRGVFYVLLGLASMVLAGAILQKGNKPIMALAFLLFVYAYGISNRHELLPGFTTKTRPNTRQNLNLIKTDTVDFATSVQAGKAVFLKNCIACHGPDGRKGVMGAFDLSLSTLPKSERLVVITQGRHAMPTFKTQLTPKQINDVANYITLLRN